MYICIYIHACCITDVGGGGGDVGKRSLWCIWNNARIIQHASDTAVVGVDLACFSDLPGHNNGSRRCVIEAQLGGAMFRGSRDGHPSVHCMNGGPKADTGGCKSPLDTHSFRPCHARGSAWSRVWNQVVLSDVFFGRGICAGEWSLVVHLFWFDRGDKKRTRRTLAASPISGPALPGCGRLCGRAFVWVTVTRSRRLWRSEQMTTISGERAVHNIEIYLACICI